MILRSPELRVLFQGFLILQHLFHRSHCRPHKSLETIQLLWSHHRRQAHQVTKRVQKSKTAESLSIYDFRKLKLWYIPATQTPHQPTTKPTLSRTTTSRASPHHRSTAHPAHSSEPPSKPPQCTSPRKPLLHRRFQLSHHPLEHLQSPSVLRLQFADTLLANLAALLVTLNPRKRWLWWKMNEPARLQVL